jgi:hypothetical protein
MNRTHLLSLSIGYVMGMFIRLKPFYYAQYYLPTEWNPFIRHFDYSYNSLFGDRDAEIMSNVINDEHKVYYEHLRVKMSE